MVLLEVRVGACEGAVNSCTVSQPQKPNRERASADEHVPLPTVAHTTGAATKISSTYHPESLKQPRREAEEAEWSSPTRRPPPPHASCRLVVSGCSVYSQVSTGMSTKLKELSCMLMHRLARKRIATVGCGYTVASQVYWFQTFALLYLRAFYSSLVFVCFGCRVETRTPRV